MRRKIVVARDECGWTVGRGEQPFERFPSKERALERARMLLERLDDEVDLVVEGDDDPPVASGTEADAPVAKRDPAPDRPRRRR